MYGKAIPATKERQAKLTVFGMQDETQIMSSSEKLERELSVSTKKSETR
jgi:hypothetical protein